MKMRTLWLIALVCFNLRAVAAVVIPGTHNGTDGVLNITADTQIDLSQAVTGTYDQDNTANAGKGVYDATQWAVVFKYSSVTIAAGTTVTFKNHPSRAPVIWLVTGAVNIAGTVSLDGQNLQFAPNLAEAGPGGFRGASASYLSGPGASAGFGPGGGFQNSNNSGFGGSYSTVGGPTGATYGNPSLVPLLGGSGGSGDPEFNSDRQGGGGGGGAILVVSAGTITLTGTIHANGGSGKSYGGEETGGGSGGGIRIVCDTLAGTGTLSAGGGSGWASGGLGRIRLERVTNNNTLMLAPDPSVVPLNAGDTALLFPPAGSPTVRVVSIGAVNAPADPRAGFGSAGADVTLPETTSTSVVIETTNVEQASQVSVRLTPRSNANAQVIAATYSSTVSPGVLRWAATLPVNVGYSAVQVKVVRP